jgi:hypothetical protein
VPLLLERDSSSGLVSRVRAGRSADQEVTVRGASVWTRSVRGGADAPVVMMSLKHFFVLLLLLTVIIINRFIFLYA